MGAETGEEFLPALGKQLSPEGQTTRVSSSGAFQTTEQDNIFSGLGIIFV